MQNLEGRVAVVTGAASGIGRGMAERWCAEGMKVVLADIEAEALATAERELRAGGAEVVSVVTDVSSAESMDALAQASLDAFGAVHLVCNNAGVGGGGMMQQLTTDDWQWVLGVNLWGVIHGIRVFLPILLQQDEAHIVNTASMAGMVSGPFMGPYNATKYAVVGISETLYKEMTMQSLPVGVSVLCPGWVDTNIADSDRNRPASLASTAAGDDVINDSNAVMRDMLKQLLTSGLKPHEVADQVADAVKSNRFYILTHPEMKPAIETRMRDILGGTNPSGPVMPF